MIIDPNEDSLPPGSEAAAFYAQMGRAIAHWAKIESGIFELFQFALVIDRQKASLLFDKFGTIGTRIETTDALMKMSVDKHWYSKWLVIKKEISSLLPFRNELAHNPVVRDEIAYSTPGGLYFAYYSQTDKRKLYKFKTTRIAIDAIKEHNRAMQKLTNDFWSLGVPKRARKRPEAPEQQVLLAGWGQSHFPQPQAKNRTPKAPKRRGRSSEG